MGKIFCRLFSARNAMGCPKASTVPVGTGAPERIKRGPIAPGRIGLIAGQRLPSFGEISGLLPVNAVVPPLDAKKPYARAPQIVVGVPAATSVLMNEACAGVMLLKVRAIGFSPGITGMVAEPVK